MTDLPLAGQLSPPSADRLAAPHRIVLVSYRRGWAYENIANSVAGLLGDEYGISQYYFSDRSEEDEDFSHLFRSGRFEHVHFLGRELYFSMLDRLFAYQKKGATKWRDFAAGIAGTVVSASVYDHLMLDKKSVAERQEKFALVDAYATSSHRLLRQYSELYLHAPTCVVEDGVDLQLFKPHDLGRFDRHGRAMTVGWAGNSAWPSLDSRPGSDDDPKGLRTIIIPALEGLRSEGLNVIGLFADRNNEWRPLSAMPDYYAGIDILVCASAHEGTPNPVLEAMACGVPVLSTDVGIVPTAFGPEQSKFLLRERTPEALKRAIRHLYENRDVLPLLSSENLRSIAPWAWHRQAPKWRALFETARASHATRREDILQRLSLMPTIVGGRAAIAR